MAAPSKWVVICCPVAGKKTGQQVVEEELIPAMKKQGIEVEVVMTERAKHATELAKQHGSATTGLIAVGGDGTIHEVMDGLIEGGKLETVRLGLLSQGTMNFYAISGGLPGPADLPVVIKSGTFRKQGLMKCNSGPQVKDMMCFEALYFGVGYHPAKGAQEWRNSMGPMFGIMLNLVNACMFPAKAAISGTMKLTLSDGKVETLQDTFYWIVVTQRNPYNATLTDDMWVSWILLEDFPGFGRMMDFFAPEMECLSSLTAAFSAHKKVKKFEWVQEDKCGPIGVCLDGDPTDGTQAITVEHVPRAWNICAEPSYPKRVPEEKTSVGWLTPAAKRWLNSNPPPAGTFVPEPAPQPTSWFCAGARETDGEVMVQAQK
mmetsp:Transcript_27223/g.65555  ORF Transcript_27223/g.65555 Transcript_27223/m.65555 type:complete len:374 (+) Transcript_27223:24-1145(+)